jgi:hypothetical protein
MLVEVPGRTGPRPAGRRTGRAAGRLAAAAVTGALLVTATAGPALADDRSSGSSQPGSSEPGSSSDGSSGGSSGGSGPGRPTARPPVVPLLDCVVTAEDGSYTAVFGYDNRGTTAVGIARGAANKVVPTPLGGSEPTAFQPGVQHAVMAVRVTKGAAPIWDLDGTHLSVRKADATECTSPTALPATGNGTGPVVALVAAGVLGAVVLHRVERRRSAAAALAEGGSAGA